MQDCVSILDDDGLSASHSFQIDEENLRASTIRAARICSETKDWEDNFQSYKSTKSTGIK